MRWMVLSGALLASGAAEAQVKYQIPTFDVQAAAAVEQIALASGRAISRDVCNQGHTQTQNCEASSADKKQPRFKLKTRQASDGRLIELRIEYWQPPEKIDGAEFNELLSHAIVALNLPSFDAELLGKSIVLGRQGVASPTLTNKAVFSIYKAASYLSIEVRATNEIF